MPRDCAAIAHTHRDSGWCGHPSVFSCTYCVVTGPSKQAAVRPAQAINHIAPRLPAQALAASASEQQATTAFIVIQFKTALSPCRLSRLRGFGLIPYRRLGLRFLHAVAEAIVIEKCSLPARHKQ